MLMTCFEVLLHLVGCFKNLCMHARPMKPSARSKSMFSTTWPTKFGRPGGLHSHLLRKITLYWGQWHFLFHQQQFSTLDAWISPIEVLHKDFPQLHKSLEFSQEQLSTLTEGNKSLRPQKLFLVYNHAAWETVLFFLASQCTHSLIHCFPHIHVFVVVCHYQRRPIAATPGTK